jgi:hypothetical protein
MALWNTEHINNSSTDRDRVAAILLLFPCCIAAGCSPETNEFNSDMYFIFELVFFLQTSQVMSYMIRCHDLIRYSGIVNPGYPSLQRTQFRGGTCSKATRMQCIHCNLWLYPSVTHKTNKHTNKQVNSLIIGTESLTQLIPKPTTWQKPEPVPSTSHHYNLGFIFTLYSHLLCNLPRCCFQLKL